MPGDVPFLPGGETGAAATTQTGRQHFIANLFRGHGANGLGRGGKSPGRQCPIENARIDDAGVAQDDLHLLLEEVGGVDFWDVGPRWAAIAVPAVEEAVAHLARHVDIENVLRHI